MISLVVGLPGTGKSYYAISKIYNVMSGTDKDSEHIDNIYTNINGVKFDYFPDSKINFSKLKLDSFYEYLIECYNCYVANSNNDNVDDLLIEIGKEKGYHNALIVFDECHDFFSGQDKIKIFWLTYHRHLFHEIILLTQNKTLIHSKYRGIPELFIEAQPRSKKLFGKSLTYKHFAAFSMKKADQFNKTVLKENDDVFNLYHSGNKSRQKSVVLKYVFIFAISLIAVISIFYTFITSFMPKEVEKKEIQKELIKKDTNNTKLKSVDTSTPIKKSNPIKPKAINDNNLFIDVYCDKYLGCKILNDFYDYRYFKIFLLKTKSKQISTIKITDTYSRHYISTSAKKLSLFFKIPQTRKKGAR